MLLCAVLPYTPVDPRILIEFVQREFPAGTGEFLVSILTEISNKSIGLISVTAIATLWSAGKGINSLIAGFNAIDDNVDRRNGIVVRLIASVYTLLFLVGVVFMLVLLVGGNFIASLLVTNIPNIAPFLDKLMSFRTLISIGVLSVLFMLCYSLLPVKKHKFRETFPGAIISALAWTGFSFLFSLYVDIFNAFSMYGSLTAIIILMFWLYICMYILFIGDNLNRYFSPVIKGILNKQPISELKGQLESLEE